MQELALQTREGSVTPHRFGKVARFLLRLPTHLYDWHIGWLFDSRLLRLMHVGRSSGHPYQTVHEVVGTYPATGEVSVMSGFGPSADWFRNLQAARAAEIAISRRRFRPQHRILDETRRLLFWLTTSDGTGSSLRSSGAASAGWSDGPTTAATLPERASSINCRWSGSDRCTARTSRACADLLKPRRQG
jgi:deazaflavin-dependent oxidoreductase (nitroreductase family)